MDTKKYKEYFNIDPKYYAAVTAELIKSGKVKWTSFYPHETFVKLLEKTHAMLSGKDSRSLWVEGAYGTGKSHAALAVKSMLEANNDEIRNYFKEYGLKCDLCEQLIVDKNNGKLITIHRIGSSSIRSDQDLILALQDSITKALKAHGIANRGEASLKEAAMRWLKKDANRTYFNTLIHEEKYMWEFGGKSADEVINDLESTDDETVVANMMRSIMLVAEDNGINALRMDIESMRNWIKSIIEGNDISAILFVWDEFTEYFMNNQNALTGFQTLAEISQETPFYFLIVTHESVSLIRDNDMRKKILDRFVGGKTVRIEMPENIAFKLMAQAMKTTEDDVLCRDWIDYRNELNENLVSVRRTLIDMAKKHATMGQKTVISDEELQAICPLHPYAALLLKHMSVAFNSNARSMFDFIISPDMTDAKGFKWFINEYGPLDNPNLLTIDMLWDFFTGKNQNGLNDDVRVILDSFNLLKAGSLTPKQERVFKTVLLLEAISMRVNDVELLRPNEQNIDLAFEGTDWRKGEAKSIAAGLCQQGLLFERPVGRGMKEYTVANRDSDASKISKLKDEVRSQVKTQDLIGSAELMGAVSLPAAIRQRFVMKGTAAADFTLTSNRLNGQNAPNRFKVVVTFALNDAEAEKIRNDILKAVRQDSNTLFYIECLTPMGEDRLSRYVENMAYCKNFMQNDRQRAKGFEEQAKKCLSEWRQRISDGAFILYAPEEKSGIREANLTALQEELQRVNGKTYFYGLEQFNLIDTMFQKGPLAQGAECGITQELKGLFKSSNANTSLTRALAGAWMTERYWEDSGKKSQPIVRIKQRVEELIQAGFETASGRISMLSILDALEEPPYGFMPANVTAFIMGFVLKEYANDRYFWSNGSSSESMTPEKMKQMIANAINQMANPSSKYKEEYIVAMGEKQRAFLRCTSEVFQIPKAQCGSIESARDQMRIKMKKLSFPIWCLKDILNEVKLESSADLLANVIDAYCGIANTANGATKATESEQADWIGALALANKGIVGDLKTLITDEMCRCGMRAYIDKYDGGALRRLADEIGDGGAYLDQVKRKFNADEANWVWGQDTANAKISDVILEYSIIAESNKSLPKCTSFQETMNEWNRLTDNIRIPYDSLKRMICPMGAFLEQLYAMKLNGGLQEQNKKKFYDALVSQREAFGQFYKDQLPYFKEAAGMFLERMDEQDVAEFFRKIPAGQFTMSREQFDQKINTAANEYKMSLKKNQLEDLWMKKTGTKDPAEWSVQYKTPILCLFDDMERGAVKPIFEALIHSNAVSEADITKAIEYLKTATFYDRLNNPRERDRCFLERVVCDYDVMLHDVEAVRKDLCENILDEPYSWMDNSAVQNRLKKQAEKAYRLGGCERAKAVINRMNPDELRQYLNDLIADNLKVGMEILKKG